MLWSLLILLALIALSLTFSYNKLVTDKHRVLSGWSDIEVQLKRHHDLIAKLISSIRQYASYEQATLQAITVLRKQVNHKQSIAQRGQIENQISGFLFSITAIAEKYPELKPGFTATDIYY